MEPLGWNELKNIWLKQTRGKSFDEVLSMRYLGARKHSSRPDQWVFLYEDDGVVWVVPYVEVDKKVFLKTLYRSRKLTKMLRKGEL